MGGPELTKKLVGQLTFEDIGRNVYWVHKYKYNGPKEKLMSGRLNQISHVYIPRVSEFYTTIKFQAIDGGKYSQHETTTLSPDKEIGIDYGH